MFHCFLHIKHRLMAIKASDDTSKIFYRRRSHILNFIQNETWIKLKPISVFLTYF
eukprot:UN10048